MTSEHDSAVPTGTMLKTFTMTAGVVIGLVVGLFCAMSLIVTILQIFA